ncbi:unnamed protein product [Candida verbasci]|uniref:Transmembrane protein n=1 Tax=Candida verbasci TaxID=1227364 RepID=A0A9W4TVT2_9ASCO|nr:unnamed protein product [Candida verbasci]
MNKLLSNCLFIISNLLFTITILINFYISYPNFSRLRILIALFSILSLNTLYYRNKLNIKHSIVFILTNILFIIYLFFDYEEIKPISVLQYTNFTFEILSVVILDTIIIYQSRSRVFLYHERVNINHQPDWYVKNQPLVYYGNAIETEEEEQEEEEEDEDEEEESINEAETIFSDDYNLSQSRGRSLIKNENSMLLNDSNVHNYYLTTPPPNHYISSNQQTPMPKSINTFESPSTSLIPCVIGKISSVNKKLVEGTKIPFSPIDFLTDDFYNDQKSKE